MTASGFEKECQEAFEVALNTRRIGRKIIAFNTIDSTNTYALEHGEDGTVYVADQQSAGRGRLGRTWFSDPGVGLWFTACFDGLVQGLTCAGALAVRDAIIARCPATIKWPNDILVDGRKVCGILVEHRNDKTVLGIGVNVRQRIEDFPEQLRERVGSLESLRGESWDRLALLRDILTNLDQKVMLLESGNERSVLDEWSEACNIVGRRIRRGSVEGVVQSIDEIGALIVETSTGVERIMSGEIEVLTGDV
ncbi:MAG: biotin--[acetyl-CoA-carboxylase] ligase [Candidatus Hydrogenedentota bacterium]